MSHWMLSLALIACGALAGCTNSQARKAPQSLLGESVAQRKVSSDQANVLPITEAQMLTSSFWAAKIPDAHKVIATADQISAFNLQNERALDPLVDLSSYPNQFSKVDLTAKINGLSAIPKSERYKDGQLLTPEYFQTLVSNLGIDQLAEITDVKYGIVTRRTGMFNFPTHDFVIEAPDDLDCNAFRETTAYLGEPIILLSSSTDKKWYFAQIKNYLAWIAVEDVALTSRSEMLEYMDPQQFLIVTGRKAETAFNPVTREVSEVPLYMGMKLPLVDQVPVDIDRHLSLANYIVTMPTRDANGALVLKNALIYRNQDVSIGYLPYTRANILHQVFKHIGSRYGWGGDYNSVDCSSLILEVYKTFGIELPRNAGEQAKTVGAFAELKEEMTAIERSNALQQFKAGAALEMPGHIMMYVGEHDGEQYIIHSLSAYGIKDQNNQIQRVRSNQVVLTTVSLLKRDLDITFLNRSRMIRQFDPK